MGECKNPVPRKSIGCGAIGVLICAVCLFAALTLLWEIRGSIIRQQVARPGKIQTKKFYVVVFPKSDAKESHVQRAVLLNLDDLTKEKFEVLISGKPELIDATSFTALPDEGKEQPDIERLNREIQRWGAETDWRSVEFFVNRFGFDGESVIKLTICSKRGGRLEYMYRVTADQRVVPVWTLAYNRI